MFRFLLPIILIVLAGVIFFAFTSPLYQSFSALQAQVNSYDEALTNSKSLEAERDKLTQKYNSLDLENLAKLSKLLPDNVDNIRLILEIEKIASPYGMVLKDVKYDTSAKAENSTTAGPPAGSNPSGTGILKGNQDYGTWDLEFSTSGSYENFLNFIQDLENNLRIVDISSITFASSDLGTASGSGGLSPSVSGPSNIYKYSFKIKTYWLRN